MPALINPAVGAPSARAGGAKHQSVRLATTGGGVIMTWFPSLVFGPVI